jgi:hypothetical protein
MKLLLLALPAGLLALLPTDALRYAPASDTTLERTFVQSRVMTLDELVVVMNGQEVPSEYLPAMELDLESDLRIVVSDVVHEAADGRPLALERTFVALERNASEEFTMAPSTESLTAATGTSPLEGERVAFTWDAEGGAYVTTRVAGSEVLDGLEEDMDLRGFLPESGDVEVGDSWEVEIAALTSLFEPGGDLRWEWSGDDLEGDYGADPELEGEVVARLASLQEGGTARVELEGELSALTEAPTDLAEVPVVDGTATELTTTTYTLEGALVWNTAAGHLERLELVAMLEVQVETQKDPGQPGGDYESTMTLSGSWSCEVTID